SVEVLRARVAVPVLGAAGAQRRVALRSRQRQARVPGTDPREEMSFLFDPSAYGPDIAALLVPERLCELGPGSPNRAIRSALEAMNAPATCRAGLWLLQDFLDESHAISQDIDTREGSFWHAIMHRREPDASNSKYWW